MPINRSMESQMAYFAAFLEDRRAAHLLDDDHQLEVAELDAIRAELYRRVDEVLTDVNKALFLASVDIRRAKAEA